MVNKLTTRSSFKFKDMIFISVDKIDIFHFLNFEVFFLCFIESSSSTGD